MRRYDLDWLRVLVFGLLIFYHVGMFFVPWSFHIKNNIIYDWLTYPMLFVNQWRLPILFVISGMGTFYALQKRTSSFFALERIKRLGLPLLFGMFCVVPPQVFYERLDKHQFKGTYIDYWSREAFIGVYPEGNLSWHHLWFLPYLLIFSLLLIPVFTYIRNHPKNKIIFWLHRRTQKLVGLYLFIIPLYFAEVFLKPKYPVNHSLLDDWFNFIHCMILFFYGFLLITVKDVFWPTVEKYKLNFLYIGMLSFIGILMITHNYEASAFKHYIESIIRVLNLWSWVLVLFGFSAKFLNKQSKILSYANEAVYPFYILHQTVIIILAYYLKSYNWSFWVKSLIMILGTFGFSWIIYELLIKRWKFVRPFFGLKNK